MQHAHTWWKTDLNTYDQPSNDHQFGHDHFDAWVDPEFNTSDLNYLCFIYATCQHLIKFPAFHGFSKKKLISPWPQLLDKIQQYFYFFNFESLFCKTSLRIWLNTFNLE